MALYTAYCIGNALVDYVTDVSDDILEIQHQRTRANDNM